MNVIGCAFTELYNIFLGYPKTLHDVHTEALPHFSAASWQTHYDISLQNVTPNPDYIALGERPCPFHDGKLIKETHILCLVPSNQTLRSLYKAMAKNDPTDSMTYNKPWDAKPDDQPYWVWITKSPVSHGSAPEIPYGWAQFPEKPIQKNSLTYCPGKLRELIAASFAFKALTNQNIFAYPENMIGCDCPDGFAKPTTFCTSVNEPFLISEIANSRQRQFAAALQPTL